MVLNYLRLSAMGKVLLKESTRAVREGGICASYIIQTKHGIVTLFKHYLAQKYKIAFGRAIFSADEYFDGISSKLTKTMGRKCFVPYCKSGYNTCNEVVAMFSCPNDPVSIRIWSDAISRLDRPLRVTDCICEKHFRDEDVLRSWKAYDRNGKEIMKVNYKRKRLRDGAVPCFFPKLENRYSRKRRKSDTVDEDKIRKILSQNYSEKFGVCPDNKLSDNLDSYSSDRDEKSEGNDTGLDEIHCADFPGNDELEDDIESDDENQYLKIVNNETLFDSIWQDTDIVDLPSKSWAVFLLQPNEERKIVFTQMGFLDEVPVPVKQVCFDFRMRIELFLKTTKLNFEEMNIKPPKMHAADDVSSFIKSVDGLMDWE